MKFKFLSFLFFLLLIVGLVSIMDRKDTKNKQQKLLEYEEHYPLLQNITFSKNIHMIPLLGKIDRFPYQDLKSNYIFQTLKITYTDEKNDYGSNVTIFQNYLYRIASNGTIINSMEIPDGLKFYSGYGIDISSNSYVAQPYIVGAGRYSDWLITGDPTIYKVPLFPSILNDTEFNKLYSEAVAVFIFNDYSSEDTLRSQGLRGYTAMMLNKQGKWEYYQAHLSFYISDNNNKTPKAYSLFLPKNISVAESFEYSCNSDKSAVIRFDDKFPSSISVNLILDHFYMTSHIAYSKWSNIMNYADYDEGIAFFKMSFHGHDFQFRSDQMKRYKGQGCFIPFNIVEAKDFLILDQHYLLSFK